ncbi:MAG: LysR family transcriptional regulator [Bauldia sp.]
MAFDVRLLSGIGVLAAVVEAGSFVRAGEAIGITQSGVSRAIARLEERVGVKLFQRTARSVALTEEGRSFFEKVQPLLSGIEEAAVDAAGAAAIVRGRLRVNVSGALGSHVLMPALGGFLDRHPQLMVELATRDRMGDLVADGFDLAVRFGEPELSAMTARLLLRTRVVTCCSPAYVERFGLPKHPREIDGHRCVLMRNPATGQAYRWEFQSRLTTVEVNPHGALMVNETDGLLNATLAGHGIAQLLGIYAVPLVASGALVQVLPGWAEERFPLYLYHRSQHHMPAKVRAFVDFLVEVAAAARKAEETTPLAADSA